MKAETFLGAASVVFAVWLAWHIGHDYGRRVYERPAAMGDFTRH